MGLFYTHKNPAAYIVLAVSGCIHSAKIQKKKVHSFPARLSLFLSLSLSGILMVSMNNILQVSSRSSLALPRRKLSNSRQVIPLRSLECSKSCPERFIVNGKKTCKEEETHFAIKMRLQPQVNINALPSRLRLCLIWLLLLLCVSFPLFFLLFFRWTILSETSSPTRMIPSLFLQRFWLVDV